jgi:predicted phage-related endonuclease
MKNPPKLGLTPDQITARAKGLGGSDSKIIAEGDPVKLIKLWKIKRGEAEGDNLDDVLAVQMGSFTERLNTFWFEKQTGLEVSREGESVASEKYKFMLCTLDGFVESQNAVWEAKHTGGFESFEKVTDRYTPQLTHNMVVCGVTKAYLSVFMGSNKWQMAEITLDNEFSRRLVQSERLFWNCVQSGEPPAAMPVEVPKTDSFKIVDMTGHNEWAAYAHEWLENKPAAALFANATKTLKNIMENDVKEAHGHGIVGRRSKAGAVTIKEAKKERVE